MKSLPKTPQVLGRIRGIFFRVALIFSLWTTVFSTGMTTLSTGCGGAGTSAATDAGTDTGTDTGTTTGTSSDLTSTESQLYDDGPIDMPVTIAKLDSPDLTKITMTVEVLSTPSISPLAVTATHRFTCTGVTGALDPSSTLKVLMYNVESGEQVSGDVASDGSFTVQIDGTLSSTLALAGGNAALTLISPALVVTLDSAGTPVITTTNTSTLNANQNVMVDNLGYYYFSTINTDSTYTLTRRNSDGTALEVIASALIGQPRLIVASSGTFLTVILQDGTMLSFTTTPSALIKPTLARAQPAYTDWTELALGNISGGLTSPPYHTGYGLQSSGDSGYFALAAPATNPTTLETNANLLTIGDVTGSSVQELISSDTYDQLRIQTGQQNSKLYLFLQSTTSFTNELARMNFVVPPSDDWSLAFDARETLKSGVSGDIANFTVADNGDVAYSYTNDMQDLFTYSVYWNATTGESQSINDRSNLNGYSTPTIVPSAEIVIMCDVGVGADGIPALVYWRVGDPVNEINDLVRFTDLYTCSQDEGSFFLTSDNLLYFYKGSNNGAAQLSVIDLNQIPGLLTQ